LMVCSEAPKRSSTSRVRLMKSLVQLRGLLGGAEVVAMGGQVAIDGVKAPLIFEGTDALPSISGGNKAARASGRTFLGFVALFIVVSGTANLVENIPLYLGIYTPQAQGGLPTVTHLTSQLMKAIFSPIWLLIALTLYRGSSSPPRFTQTGASSVEPGD